jgi:XFP N-terminal domain
MASPSLTGSARPQESKQPLSQEEVRKMHAYWRAANYLSVGQIYLYANPLLQIRLNCEPLHAPISPALASSSMLQRTFRIQRTRIFPCLTQPFESFSFAPRRIGPSRAIAGASRRQKALAAPTPTNAISPSVPGASSRGLSFPGFSFLGISLYRIH